MDGDLGVVLGNLRHRMRDPIEASGIKFRWQVGELPPIGYLTPRTILTIQRIILEAIVNALRHAEGNAIAVRTHVDSPGGGLLIQVIDDGKGFDVSTARRGRGLNNLYNRASSIGATIEIKSTPRQGTNLTLVLPIHQPLT